MTTPLTASRRRAITLGTAGAGVLLLVVLISLLTSGPPSEIGTAQYQHYQVLAEQFPGLRGPLKAALANDGIIDAREAANLDRIVRRLSSPDYQPVSDARVDLEKSLDRLAYKDPDG